MEPSETIRLLRDGAEALPAMLDAIRAATREVTLEMYWFDDSPVAWTFIDALADRAREGVKVFVLYDAIGSLGSDRERFRALRALGAEVLEYNPVAPWRQRFRATRVSRRDHRKVLTVDGAVAFCGGLNLGKPWAPIADGGEGWRDDVARVTGRAAQTLRAMFFDVWRRQLASDPIEARVNSWRQRSREAQGELSHAGERSVVVLGHDGWAARRAIRRAYLSRIRSARRVILLENSYFLPDRTVRRALGQAARRGVEVRVIVPAMGDVPAVTYATRGLYAGMFKRGMHVHEWQRGVLHAKTGLVDDWATTGSYNLDFVSLRYNLEVNVASTDASFVRSVEASLRKDIAEGCAEVDPVRWSQRAVWERVREWGFMLGRTFL